MNTGVETLLAALQQALKAHSVTGHWLIYDMEVFEGMVAKTIRIVLFVQQMPGKQNTVVELKDVTYEATMSFQQVEVTIRQAVQQQVLTQAQLLPDPMD